MKNELQSRRDFFRKITQKSLPILGVIVFGPAVFSCDREEDPLEVGSGGGSGSGSGSDRCGGLCTANCRSSCKANAVWQPSSCSGTTCKNACYRTCKTSCYHTNKHY